jgi:UPF0716 family protein affecting phage T7 exclusion
MADQLPNPTGAKEGPGKGFVSMPGIILIAGYLVLVVFTVIHGLVVLWPPNRDQEIDQIKKAIKQSVAEVSKGQDQQSDSGNQTPPAGKSETNSPGGSGGSPPATDGTTDVEQPLAQTSESQSSESGNTSGEAGDQIAEDSATGSGDKYCAEKDQKGQEKATFLWFFTLCLSPEEREV